MEERYIIMKKTLSRLICVLLVAVMVCGMIPVVSATTSATVTGDGSESWPYIMYVGDKVDCKITPCTTAKHETKVTYTAYFNGVEQTATTSGTYVSYDTSTQQFTAKSATFKNGEVGYVKAEISCVGPKSDKDSTKVNCGSFTHVVKYFVAYAKATSLTLKTETGGTISSTLNVPKSTKVYCTVSPATTKLPDNLSAEIDDKTVATVSGPNKDENGYYFTVTRKNNSSASTTLTIKADSVEKEVTVITGSAAVLTVKNGTTEVARSNDDSTRDYLDLSKNDTLTLTPSADSSLGTIGDTQWSSSDDSVIALSGKNTSTGAATFKVMGTGLATVTAKLGGVSTTVKIRVLSNISAIDIRENTSSGDSITNTVEKTLGDNSFTVAVKVTPNDYQSDAAYTIWKIADKDVVDFYNSSSSAVDADTGCVTAASVCLKAVGVGTTTVTATLGTKTDSFTIKVEKTVEKITINKISTAKLSGKVRSGSVDEIVERMNNNPLFDSVYGEYEKDGTKYGTQVPVKWYDAEISSDKKTATVRGNAVTSDGENTYAYTCATAVTAEVELTNDAIVSKLSVTGDKSTAVAGNVINLTATATVEPSDAKVTYQWYQNGKAIDGATSATAKYTIPQASSDSSTTYDFTCVVTASKAGTSNSATSQPFTVTVSRDYTVSISVNDSNATYTVGEKPKATATLYYKGTAVNNVSFSWNLLDNSKGNTLNSEYATITGSGSSATLATKGTASDSGDKYVIQASVTYTNGYTYTGSQTITVKPATAKDVKMSVGDGGNIKSSTLTSAVTTAVNNTDITTSYVTFGTPTGGSLYTSSSAKTALGTSTACYVSGSSGQLLNNVYFVPKSSASSCYVTYTAYNAKGGAIATGKVNFDTSESNGTNIYSKGTDMESAGVVDDLASANANASYVVFGDVKGGTLYYNYKSFTSKTDVETGDKFYFSGSNKLLEDVYFLPAADTYTATVAYTVYSSSGSSLSSDKITFTTVKQTSSRTFTDVTASNDGAWASNAIDFMAANSIVGGTGNNKFSPSDNMTRAQLVTVLYRAEGQPSVSGLANPFTDVASSQYYYKAVLWAYSKGIVTGNSATTFNPDGNISRQDIAVILYRYAGNPTATGSVTSFTDNAKIDSYALTAMKWAVGSGIIGGSNNKLTPTGQASRAQVAAMLHRFFTK